MNRTLAMPARLNRKIVLAARPNGVPGPEDFAIVDEHLPALTDGRMLIRHEALGLAPAARLRMSAQASYAAPLALGETVYGQAVGRVVESRHPQYRPGDRVMAMAGGWQLYSVSDGTKVWPIDTRIAPPTVWLGALGVSGMTAWTGLRIIGSPRAGETVVVSAVTGGVGSVAAQLAHAWGCRVVGVAGGSEKCEHAKRHLGIDACVDYRDPGFATDLAAACPDGVDVYFDNVGGKVRDAVWQHLNRDARAVVCGLISEYNALGGREAGPPWFDVLSKRLTVRGFILSDHLERRAEFVEEAGRLYQAGRLRVHEDVSHGLGRVPAAFAAMLQGRNLGKTVVYLETEDPAI